MLYVHALDIRLITVHYFKLSLTRCTAWKFSLSCVCSARTWKTREILIIKCHTALRITIAINSVTKPILNKLLKRYRNIADALKKTWKKQVDLFFNVDSKDGAGAAGWSISIWNKDASAILTWKWYFFLGLKKQLNY